MKTKILGCIVGLGVMGFSFISCSEPAANCLVEDDSGGPYIVTYTVQGTAPACAASFLLPGEPVGMSAYHPEVTNSDGSTTFDAAVGHVAIQANTIGNADENVYAAVGVGDATPGDEPYAYGRFKAPLPDSNNLCYVVTDQGITCTAAGAKCTVDEDCCNAQCNIPANFTCTSDSDCPTSTTCACNDANGKATACTSMAAVGGNCAGPSLCADLVDNLTAKQVFSGIMDTGAGIMPPIGTPCMANTDCGQCALDGATCAADTDCCSGSCTGTSCAAAAAGMMEPSPTGLTCNMGMCALAACDPANMDADCGSAASGLICDATAKTCTLGCRGSMGNGCDATFECSSTDATAGACGLPANTMTYAYSNVQIYTTAAAQGTQFSATVTVSQTVAGAPCQLTYTAVGMWPAVGCSGVDAMGNPTGMPDDDMCNPCAEPSNGRAVGSGINFNFPTHCDMNLLTCVLGMADSSYTVNQAQAAKGIFSVTGFKNATTIPQVMPDGDARIPICQGQ